MATVDDILDEIYRRTRDPDRVATPEALGIEFVNQAQRAVNLAVRSQVAVASLTLPTGQLIYQISNMPALNSAARIEGVRIKNADTDDRPTRDLVEVSWQGLWQINAHWFRATGPLSHWARIGRDMFAVYPGPAVDTPVYIVNTTITAALTTVTDTIVLRNEFFPFLLDLTEALFLLRLRLIGSSSALSKSSEPFDVVLARLKGAVGMK